MKIEVEMSIQKCIVAIIAIVTSICYVLSTDLSFKFAVAFPVMLFLGFLSG